jgi:hypothetical protein
VRCVSRSAWTLQLPQLPGCLHPQRVPCTLGAGRSAHLQHTLPGKHGTTTPKTHNPEPEALQGLGSTRNPARGVRVRWSASSPPLPRGCRPLSLAPVLPGALTKSPYSWSPPITRPPTCSTSSQSNMASASDPYSRWSTASGGRVQGVASAASVALSGAARQACTHGATGVRAPACGTCALCRRPGADACGACAATPRSTPAEPPGQQRQPEGHPPDTRNRKLACKNFFLS